jgi:hypothetical protein
LRLLKGEIKYYAAFFSHGFVILELKGIFDSGFGAELTNIIATDDYAVKTYDFPDLVIGEHYSLNQFPGMAVEDGYLFSKRGIIKELFTQSL